jgi:predicted 2-oxoglutarate/Fe(II)-dependent dioxygenase YbiX
MAFYGTARDATGETALTTLRDKHRFIDDSRVSFFCVCMDPTDKTELAVDVKFPSLQFLWDIDGAMHRAYGVASRVWIVLDPMLRVADVIPFTVDGTHISRLLALLDALPPSPLPQGFEIPIPVLVLPDVFEPAFCLHLIHHFEVHGGKETGFMQEVDGTAVEIHDTEWKRRKDHTIADEALIDLIKARMARRAGVMMQKAFHFTLSRMERHLIACYSAEDGGHFGPHRDDTVKATEHRRFAVSINLNDDFDGGELSFPEFSDRQFKAPIGTAMIFSSSLLHRVCKVTRGRRFAFLPFCHDEAAEKLRLANLRYLSPAGFGQAAVPPA